MFETPTVSYYHRIWYDTAISLMFTGLVYSWNSNVLLKTDISNWNMEEKKNNKKRQHCGQIRQVLTVKETGWSDYMRKDRCENYKRFKE